MPVNMITNILAEETETAYPGLVIGEFVNGDTVSLKVGQLVELITNTTGIATKIKRSSATADFKLVGVVVGGKSPAATVGIGTVAQVCTEGPAQVLSKGNTTKGNLAIQSTATAGIAKSTTAVVAGKTIGWYTQSKTIASGTALAWMYVHKV